MCIRDSTLGLLTDMESWMDTHEVKGAHRIVLPFCGEIPSIYKTYIYSTGDGYAKGENCLHKVVQIPGSSKM